MDAIGGEEEVENGPSCISLHPSRHDLKTSIIPMNQVSRDRLSLRVD